jgi:GNAT superfamily N-acetyltransferase
VPGFRWPGRNELRNLLERLAPPLLKSRGLIVEIRAADFIKQRHACALDREYRGLGLGLQMAHVLWQQRCLEVASRLHHVGVVDETRRTYRHHGRQRDAPRRIATFRHATQRVATHRYATLEPLGKPGGSRAFSADAPLNRLWLRDAYRSQPEAETEEI